MLAVLGRTMVDGAVTAVAVAALQHDQRGVLSLKSKLVPVERTPTVDDRAMVPNDATPEIDVGPETCEVPADGAPIAREPATALPLAQRCPLH